MSLKSRTINAVIWALVQNGSRQLISTLVFLLLARFFLSKDEFGLVALASILITFLTVLVRQGFGAALVQRQHIENKHLDTVFWVNVFSSILLVILVNIFATQIGELLREPRVAILLQVLSLHFVFSALSLTHEAILTRELKFKSLAYRTLVASLLSGIVGIVFAYYDYGVWALIAMQLSMTFVGLIMLWQASNWRPGNDFSFEALKELLPMSLNMAGVAIIATINDLIDQFIIGALLGTPALGIYFVAQRINKLLITVLVQSISSVALPSFSRLEGDVDKIRNSLIKSIRISTFISFPIFGGLSVTADIVIPMLFGDKWSEASEIMSVLCISGIIGSITYYFSPVLTALNRSGDVLKNQMIVAVMLTTACIIGSRYGLIGVAIGIVLQGMFIFPIWLINMNRALNLRWNEIINSFVNNFIVMVIMIISIAIFRGLVEFEARYNGIIACIGVGAVTYIAVGWHLSNESAKEAYEVFKHIVKKQKTST